MARRKIRPFGVLAVIAVFAFIQLLRKGSPEVFTFDSYPPYTDNPKYVKKPTPTPMPWSKPPPPPPEWVEQRQHQQHPPNQPNQQHQPNPEGKPLPGDSNKSKPPTANKLPPKKPQPMDPPLQFPDTEERPAYADTASKGGDFVEDTPENEYPFHSPKVHDLSQPPAPGHFNPNPEYHHPSYTPEELVPRVEKYPIPADQIIRLPKMKPNTLPRVQARFHAESAEQKRIRSQRQAAIKRAMTRSWEAYSTYAMGHDELRPVSGRVHDPFCGWGATLVDSLDTLQIMGMHAEYEEALTYVEKVDFAHTRSYSIPLFETVIRYLGGLLGAFDVSNGKDTMLLDKAKDLADMLMGAFDTVNRMPLLRYDWRPQAARQNLRASEDSCLAEMGTLTLEFTRLAQLTGNHTYFDAVQRITDGFEGFQFSHVPGLFPVHIDASGCKYVEIPIPETQSRVVDAPVTDPEYEEKEIHLNKRAPPPMDGHVHQKDEGHLEDSGRANMANAMRESLADQTVMPAGQVYSSSSEQVQAVAICDPQPLIPSIFRDVQEFSFGGEADSTYEYFIKEHILLGGVKEQYKKLYVSSVEAAEKYLFFQPLAEGNPDIMLSGKYRSNYKEDGTPGDGELLGEMQHLTCFVGGMLALGSKIMNRPHDLMLAEKITDGCVWAYNITATGVMPETFGIDVCYQKPCTWIPPPEPEVTDDYPEIADTTVIRTVEENESGQIQVNNDDEPYSDDYGSHRDNRIHQNVKRAALPDPAPPAVEGQSRQGPPLPPDRPTGDDEIIEVTKHIDVDPVVQKIALDRQQANLERKKISRPASFHSYMDARYILRPEAIESVFYMWRITGDPIWQEKGWHMWESIEKVSWTELAYSAISDVNNVNGTQADSMESFWLAETLKYFYLLYSEPSLISLDEWVFNTEAHPFKRPNPGER